MEFVKDEQPVHRLPAFFQDRLLVLIGVPVEIDTARLRFQDRPGEGGLANLTGTAQKDHFPLQVGFQVRLEITHLRAKDMTILKHS
jgi:hypothetical protein